MLGIEVRAIHILYAFTLFWLTIAAIQDLRKREVENWINFSLIIFALAFRLFYSVFSSNFSFFVFGLLGFVLFFVLANIFYYSRVFAGGDAKLLMALGSILPFYSDFVSNLVLMFYFVFLFLIIGSFYGLVYSLVLVMKNKRRFLDEFRKQTKERKSIFYVSLIFVFISLILALLSDFSLVLFPLIFLLFPFLFIYAKSVEEVCMVKAVRVRELREGDWLYSEIRAGRKRIKPDWQGISKRELSLIKKHCSGRKKILIKQGLPFIPVFLISFILFFVLLGERFLLI